MTDALKIDWILHGLDPDLVGKILALVPETFIPFDLKWPNKKDG